MIKRPLMERRAFFTYERNSTSLHDRFYPAGGVYHLDSDQNK
jgi:hypothetical protein